MIDKAIGRVLEDYRWNMRLLSKQMGEKIGWPSSKMTKVIQGKTALTLAQVMDMCDKLGIDTMEFIEKVIDHAKGKKAGTSGSCK